VKNIVLRPARARYRRGVLAAAAASLAGPAFAAGTVAGTSIDNVATATYELPGGGEDSVTSNIVSLKVDELLDVAVASAEPGHVAASPGATGQVLRFAVTNAGNGGESFTLPLAAMPAATISIRRSLRSSSIAMGTAPTTPASIRSTSPARTIRRWHRTRRSPSSSCPRSRRAPAMAIAGASI